MLSNVNRSAVLASQYCLPESRCNTTEYKQHLTWRVDPKDPESETFSAYTIKDGVITMPRSYGLQHHGLPGEWRLNAGTAWPAELKFVGQLANTPERPQVDAVKATLKHLRNPSRGHNGVLSLCAGSGKTLCSLAIMSELRVKTLFICHKDFLMQQAKDAALRVIPGIQVGWIQGDTFDVDGKHLVFATIQTLYRREYVPEIFQEYGLVVVDESKCTPSLHQAK